MSRSSLKKDNLTFREGILTLFIVFASSPFGIVINNFFAKWFFSLINVSFEMTLIIGMMIVSWTVASWMGYILIGLYKHVFKKTYWQACKELSVMLILLWICIISGVAYSKHLREAKRFKAQELALDINSPQNAVTKEQIELIAEMIRMYAVDHDGELPPRVITIFGEISKDRADICDELIPEYGSHLPIYEKKFEVVTDCERIYETRYLIRKSPDGQSFTIKAQFGPEKTYLLDTE